MNGLGRATEHLLLGAGFLALAVLVGCEQGSSTTGGDTGNALRDRADNRAVDRRGAGADAGETAEPRRGNFNLDGVAGVKEGTRSRGGKAPDALFSLYDVGRGSRGVSRTTIHVFPESSKHYSKLVYNPQGYVPKRIPDDAMEAMLEAARKDGFTGMLKPMSKSEIERQVSEGNSVITLEERGRLKGVIRPRLKAGASKEQIEIFQGMKRTFMAVARAYTTPIVSGGTGFGRDFQQPNRR